jgi:uncharacterized protein (TIGR00106 family)
MNVTVDFSLIPVGGDLSFSGYIAECQRVLQQAGVDHELHPFGTTIQGEWDTVMAALKRCTEAVHGQGVPRVFTTLKIGTRTDRAHGDMRDKVESVRRSLRS